MPQAKRRGMGKNMNIISPQLSKEFILIEDFSLYAQDFLLDEMLITEIKSCETLIEGADFHKIEIQNCIFENCIFRNCSFENASFVDVMFQSCDLSNSKFVGAYFERCQFTSCKCIGIDMSDTVLKHISLKQSKLQYSCFDKTKMTDVLFEHIDFISRKIEG